MTIDLLAVCNCFASDPTCAYPFTLTGHGGGVCVGTGTVTGPVNVTLGPHSVDQWEASVGRGLRVTDDHR